MQLSDLDYSLPDDLIAQEPAVDRAGSRMMLVDRATADYADRHFTDLPNILRDGDLLVLNNTKVFPARLFGTSETGARVEIFLIDNMGDRRWRALARPGRRLRPGKRIAFGQALDGTVVEKLDGGLVVIDFAADGDLDEVIDRVGTTPLPPYIKRPAGDAQVDRERYQTVYAKNRGAIAAPTAGLHFTPEVIERLAERGVRLAEITLHVGYGTFEPVRVQDLSEHKVAAERYEIGDEAAEILTRAKVDGRRIIAVGTTTTRALESNHVTNGRFTAGAASADLTITPGYRFEAVDGLLTNFHLPQSSLLVLTSVFGGYDLIMKAYKQAVEARYRFYSYGDCMLII